MSMNQIQRIKIQWEPSNSLTKEQKIKYLLCALKETNPLLCEKQDVSIQEVLVSETKLLIQKKQTPCRIKSEQLKLVLKNFEALEKEIEVQKQMKNKYAQRIQKHMDKLERQAHEKFVRMSKMRVGKQLQLTQKIDQMLSRLSSELNDNQNGNLTSQIIYPETAQLANLMNSPKTNSKLLNLQVSAVKGRFHQLSRDMCLNESKLENFIKSKSRQVKNSLERINSSIKKLAQLQKELQQFERLVKEKIHEARATKTSRENDFIASIEKIVYLLNPSREL